MSGSYPIREVYPGDFILAEDMKFVTELARSARPMPGPGLRMVDHGGRGCSWEAETSTATFVGAFHVVRAGEYAKIAVGLCDDEVPWIDGRRMDGRDIEGRRLPEGAPRLRLDLSMYDEEGNSWVCLAAKVGKDGKRIAAKDGGLFIVQSRDPRIVDGASIDVDGVGLDPLGWFYRNPEEEQTFGKLIQVRNHSCRHRFVAGTLGRPGRHFFW